MKLNTQNAAPGSHFASRSRVGSDSSVSHSRNGWACMMAARSSTWRKTRFIALLRSAKLRNLLVYGLGDRQSLCKKSHGSDKKALSPFRCNKSFREDADQP